MLDRIQQYLYKNRHRYLSKSIFVENPGGFSDLAVNNTEFISLFDFVKEILTIKGCCNTTESTNPLPDILVPMNMFTNQPEPDSIDLYQVIESIGKQSCSCNSTAVIAPVQNQDLYRNLYFDKNRLAVNKPIITGYANAGYYLFKPQRVRDFADQQVTPTGPNNAIFLSDIVFNLTDDVLNCCVLFPFCGIALNPDQVSLDLTSQSISPTCGGTFTAVIEYFPSATPTVATITQNYTQATYPANPTLIGIGLTAETWNIKQTFTDCIGTVTCNISLTVPPITNEILTTSDEYVTTNVQSNSPLCQGNYNVTYNVRNSSMTIVHTVSYTQDTNPGFVDIGDLGLSCGTYTFESVATDCVSSSTVQSTINVSPPPVANQAAPNTGTLGSAALDGSTSTACDTDNLPDTYSWCLSDDYDSVIESTAFIAPTATITGATYITGTGQQPTIDIESLYDNALCNQLPDAKFTYTNSSVVVFDMDGSQSTAGSCPGAVITDYTWRVYSQTLVLLQTITGTDPTPQITFPNTAQTYHIVLEVTSTCGKSTQTQDITIAFDDIEAIITKEPTGTTDEFNFTASGSEAGNCPSGLITFLWEFIDTDQTTVLATASTADTTYQFTGSGTKYTRLTVTNACGQSSNVIEPYDLGSTCGTYTFPTDIYDVITGLKITESTTANSNTISFHAKVT